MAGVKCLASSLLGLVFGRGLAVVFRQNTAASQSSVFAGNSVFRLRGNPAYSSGSFRSFGVLVPGAMGRAGAKYREWACSIGCRNKLPGYAASNQAHQFAAYGRRTPFTLRLRLHYKGAVVRSVKSTGREAQWVADIEGKMISYQ